MADEQDLQVIVIAPLGRKKTLSQPADHSLFRELSKPQKKSKRESAAQAYMGKERFSQIAHLAQTEQPQETYGAQ
eukprot:2436434-Amphidinium_carterae.1